MKTVLEEMARVDSIDTNTIKVMATGMFSLTQYEASVEPLFYESATGAIGIFVPTIGTIGKIRNSAGIITFQPIALSNNTATYQNVLPIDPGDFILRGPTGALLKIGRDDKITIGSGMGLARTIYSGTSNSIIDLGGRYTLSVSGTQLEIGPVIPGLDTAVVPTRLSLSVNDLSGVKNVGVLPTIQVELGSTSLKNVVMNILTSLLTILIRKTGTVEIGSFPLGSPSYLTKEEFLEYFCGHTHPGVKSGSDMSGTPMANGVPSDPIALKTLYSTTKLKSE